MCPFAAYPTTPADPLLIPCIVLLGGAQGAFHALVGLPPRIASAMALNGLRCAAYAAGLAIVAT
jgi:hypothetical protein